MRNETIKNHASLKKVYLWQVAKKLGISDTTFSRKLRDELDEEEKSKILAIIDEIANKKENLC